MAENKNKKRSRNTIPVMGRVVKFVLENYKYACLTVVLCLFITALTTLYSTLFTRSLIDDFILPLISSQNPNYDALFGALARLAAVLLLGVIASYTYNRIMVNVTQGSLNKMRLRLFFNMEAFPIKYFDTHPHGAIMSVYTNDIDTLRQVISQTFPQTISSLISVISTFISMVVLDIPLTILCIIMVCVMLFVTQRMAKFSRKFFSAQQKELADVNAYIEEMIEGQRVVKVFCHEEKSVEGFNNVNQKLFESAKTANIVGNTMMPVNANLGNITYVLCAVVGGLLALGGHTALTLGILVTFLTLSREFTRPVTQLSQQAAMLVTAVAGAERMFALYDEKPETDDGYVQLVNAREDSDGTVHKIDRKTNTWAWEHPHKEDGSVTYTKLQGDIVFDDVDFGYTDDKMILHNIDLHALPGQKVALVGSTGAGKTTITNLINRFYDIQDGKIRYDMINVNKIKKSDLRRSLGMVLQDTSLFSGTVMENLRYGRLDATDGDCVAAAKLANADSFISRLPDGYNTVLSAGGSSLSQGERQLLAIARAAVADPPVLILDEATSSIDTRTERLVQRGMDALMKGRTSFVIAHRLSTVRNADCILVMELGRIIERGTHEELLAQKGRYYELYTGMKAEH